MMVHLPRPPRRWFQYRLTTWFVLVAILAWAMLQRPFLVTSWDQLSTRKILGQGVGGGVLVGAVVVEVHSLNPALLYPALALAAFVGWKAARAIWRRVVRRKAKQGQRPEIIPAWGAAPGKVVARRDQGLKARPITGSHQK